MRFAGENRLAVAALHHNKKETEKDNNARRDEPITTE